jgi:hypothetical protein
MTEQRILLSHQLCRAGHPCRGHGTDAESTRHLAAETIDPIEPEIMAPSMTSTGCERLSGATMSSSSRKAARKVLFNQEVAAPIFALPGALIVGGAA